MEATLRPSRPSNALGVPVALPQHSDQHPPRRQILLAVDQEFGAIPSARRPARAPRCLVVPRPARLSTLHTETEGREPACSKIKTAVGFSTVALIAITTSFDSHNVTIRHTPSSARIR